MSSNHKDKFTEVLNKIKQTTQSAVVNGKKALKKPVIGQKATIMAKDTSGKLKKIHGRGHKTLAKKKRKSEWHKNFYSDAPKTRGKRILWFLHPLQQFRFWFSRNGLIMLGKATALGFAVFALTIVGLYAYYSRELPGREEITNRIIQETTKFYDRTGKTVLYEVYGDENRTIVEFDKVSEHAKNATVAIEDKNFYEHNGISVVGITRSALENTFGDDETSPVGGSTITQQFVKNSLLTRDKTYERKIKEAILALELERIYTKEEILGFYLNEVPYGGTAYGIESAAQNYFAKSAEKLTIDESAMLAAMIQRPSYFSPFGDNTEQLDERKDFVINLMRNQGYISNEEADEAIEVETLEKIKKNGKKQLNIKAPHFVLEVQQQLEEKYGSDIVAKGGLNIITTIDLKLQEQAEAAVKDNISIVDAAGGNNAALVAADPKNGQVLAMVGSRDFDYPEFGNFNAATARRQPGSSFKPYTYATLMKNNYGAGSVFYDVRTDFGGGYTPTNFDNRFKGANSVREHLGQSRNIPAIKALYMAGLENVMEQVEKQGVSLAGEASDYGLSLTLGAGEVKLSEHVNGYTAFANGGKNYGQIFMLKVTNQNGEVLEEWTESEGEQVLDEQIAYIIANMLADEAPRTRTFGASLRYFRVPGETVAIKTGTTNELRDGWLMGFTSEIVAGVWVGHTDNLPMNRAVTGMTGPIWNQFMTAAHEERDGVERERPSGVKTITLDRYTGRAPVEGSSNTVTDIFPSWFKAPKSEVSEPFEIDTVSNKLATECTPDAARKTVSAGGISAEIPSSDPAFGRWNPPVIALAQSLNLGSGTAVKPTEEDDVHKCSDKKPKINNFEVTEGDSGTYTLSVDIQKGTFGLTDLDFRIDGQIVSGGALSITKSGNYTVDNVTIADGQHTLSVSVLDKGLYSVDDSFTKKFKKSDAPAPDPGNGEANGQGGPSLPGLLD